MSSFSALRPGACLFREAHTTNASAEEPVADAPICDLAERPGCLRSERATRHRGLSPGHPEAPREAHGPSEPPKTATAPLVAILSPYTEFHEKLPSCADSPHAKNLFFTERAALERSAHRCQTAYFVIRIHAQRSGRRTDERLRQPHPRVSLSTRLSQLSDIERCRPPPAPHGPSGVRCSVKRLGHSSRRICSSCRESGTSSLSRSGWAVGGPAGRCRSGSSSPGSCK